MKKPSPEEIKTFNEVTRLISGGWKVPDAARRFGITEDRYFKLEYKLDLWRARPDHGVFDGSIRRGILIVFAALLAALLILLLVSQINLVRGQQVRPVLSSNGTGMWQKRCEFWKFPMNVETDSGPPQDTYEKAAATPCRLDP